MITITTENTIEFEPNHFITNASDLGLPPGRFPLGLETTLGNQHPFLVKCIEGEDAGLKYVQPESGCTLIVIND